MTEINLRIDGMHCDACIRRVTQALQSVTGSEVESVRVGGARIRLKNDSATAQALIEAVGKAGFSASPEN